MVVMGVAGSGKTSVGEALARAVGAVYLDGDMLHPPANIAKMSAGVALTDKDRWPWLARVGEALRDAPTPMIVGCSALKKAYRDFIAGHAGGFVRFIYLEGSRELIAGRMSQRAGHFMPPSLLESQFAALEPPGSEENAITVAIDRPLEAIVGDIVARLTGGIQCQVPSR